MENDLISRSALIEVLRKSHSYHAETARDFSLLCRDIRLVKEAPAVDAVEVVRCKDCKYFHQKVSCGGFCKCGEVNGGRPHMRVNEDFCSYGERRADE